MRQYALVCTGMYWYVLVCPGMFWYVLVCTSMYQHLLWFPIHQFRPSPLLDTWRYIKVHGSTWQYRKVLYTWIMAVLQGRSRYIKVQGFVLPCTLKYRHNPGIQDFPVLPCTSMYLHVSSNGEGRNWWIGNQSKRWYIPVHTSTYQYIPGHTRTYQYILVHTSTYQYILSHTNRWLCVLVHTCIWLWQVGLCQYIPAHTCTYLLVPNLACTYQYIPVHTSIYKSILECTRM